MSKQSKSENWIVFVDTNILLDFYRLRGDSAIRQIAALERHKDRLITGDQVRMEYLKNRQRVIFDTLKELKKPTEQKLPPILSDYQPAKSMRKNLVDATENYKTIQGKIQNILSDPSKHDDVYKGLNRIFRTNTSLNLNRKKERREILRTKLGEKKILLGLPTEEKGRHINRRRLQLGVDRSLRQQLS